jgi:signal transduction histidine kinase
LGKNVKFKPLMKPLCSLLHLEDNPDDALLVAGIVAAEWPSCEIKRVDTRVKFLAEVSAGGIDLILADYSVPCFDGRCALELARKLCPEVPFVFLSGTMGEDVAVESLKAGATDYVIKDHLPRLVPALRRALQEAEDRAQRKRAEEKVQRIQASLEQSNRDLVRRNQEIQNFYHTLSHELKTPLTSAREFVAIVLDGLGGPITDTQREYLGIARHSCDQLCVCINDLLDATRLETGKLTLELKPTALDVLVHRLVTALGVVAGERRIALTEDLQAGLPEVFVDEHRISQVITNLLNNALKYTLPGGKVVAKVAADSSYPELIQVSVTDTGRGVPKGEQEHIFDRLYQVKRGDAATEEGVGLGLYLCRELVQLHGGRIWLESEPGKGSTFNFVIPRSPNALRCNLLVVDDDEEMLGMLLGLLPAEEYNVRTAHNGLQALEQMRQETPDIVLLDLAMPEMDGPTTLNEIRRTWGPIPVIVHTGHADSSLIREALAFSPFTVLAKPYTADQLLECIRRVQRSGDTAVWQKNHHGLTKVKHPHGYLAQVSMETKQPQPVNI